MALQNVMRVDNGKIINTQATAAEAVSYDNTESGLSATDVQEAVDELKSNFQDGVDAVYDAVVAKGSTPASHSLSDIIAAIAAIPTGITPSGTLSITSNGTKDVTQYASANVAVPNSNSGTYTPTSRSASLDMGATNSYRYVNTNSVPNSNSGTYTYPSGSKGGKVDLGATNSYRYVNATNVYNKGKADGDVKHTISIYGNGHSGDWNSIIIKEGSTELARGSCSSGRAYNITI